MKTIAIMLNVFFLVQIGYCQDKKSFFIDHDKDFLLIDNVNFFGNDTLKTRYCNNGNIQTIGKYAIDEFGKISNLRIGKWIEYYSNGATKSIGEYQISSYIDCGIAGYERIFYNYKIGDWIYYFPDSTIEAQGTYKIIKTKIDTRCEKGDDLIFMTTTNDWDFFTNQSKTKNICKIKYELISDESDNLQKIIYCYDRNLNKVVMKLGNKKDDSDMQ